MVFKDRTLTQLADMICGNDNREGSAGFFTYRSSSYLTRFFQEADTDYRHNGSTRGSWVEGVLQEILSEPAPAANMPAESFQRVIRVLMDQGDAKNEGPERPSALSQLNAVLQREGYEAFYSTDKQCYLRHIGTKTVATASVNPHRPLSAKEIQKREQLAAYLNSASEDDLIEEVLMPLFRQLGFHRITVAGHKDKALEYGKDIWMRYTLPTQHVLYFGIQAKKGKLDASGAPAAANANIAEIHNQVNMMLGHEVFDPEIGKKVLVDHAFIVAGGEITKQARNWLGGKLDATKRSQILFMDREDILNLFVVANLPLPGLAISGLASIDDEIPF